MRPALLLWLLLLALPARAQLRVSPAATVQLRLLLALTEHYRIPGLQLVYTAPDGRTTTLSQGVQCRGEQPAVDDHTVFQAASLSKPVFAYLVLRLVDRGVLDLDAPLARYGLPHKHPQNQLVAARITARMVLRHTSGLPHWAEYADHVTRWQQNVLTLKYPPDSLWHYSGEGYAYLQQVVEHLTGKDLQQLAREEVFGPLGMADSSFGWDARFTGRLCAGHDSTGTPTLRRRFREPSAAFSLVSTATDYSRFVRALAQGTGLRPATHQLLLTASGPAARCGPPGSAGAHLGWGLGVGLQESSRGRALWHWGDNVDFRNFFLVFADTGESVVFLTNSENGLRAAPPILNLFLGPDEYWALQWLQER
ncbi:serine hydrolase domain-containing protein [Hymenobacter edaphi]|uniref:Serine hydrolase n=1 Tax=Hymenobacter edaphi TaxID=2211146 RepID=A0A328BU67_9BACT|nr:serine hydrolase domain-containing protein [Hymenobacter edaphi]RAK69424.1 serine hydrolase [Hymenobacter edaphi]